jgi:curli biogenesis system outer membrane secretion channel CsgG
MKSCPLLVACLALLALSPAHAQSPAPAQPPASAPQRLTLGVSDIKVLPALAVAVQKYGTANSLNRIAQSLDSQLIAALSANNKFQVVSRSDLASVLKEQGLSQSGNVDPNSLIQSFKLAGAKIILVTTIDDFEDRVETGYFGAAGTAQNRKVTLSCVGKLYDAQTGNLTTSTNYQLTDADVRNNPSNITSKGGAWADDLLINLTRLMAGKIALRTTDILYPAKVIAKTDNQITLNRGDGTGIAPGQIWIIYAPGKPLIDPDTGENLGTEEVTIGKARITAVTPRTASADLLEDRGVTLLNIARQDATAPAPAPAPAQ